MKFRLKTTLCMVCLVSLLFGAGSCALISFSFQNALEREQAAARSAYALLVRTLQLVETVEVWSCLLYTSWPSLHWWAFLS